MYDVDHVVRAEKNNGRWHVLVKWTGWSMPTWEPKSKLMRDSGDEVRRQILKAVFSAQTGGALTRIHRGRDPEDSESSGESDDEGSDGEQMSDADTVFAVMDDGEDLGPEELRCACNCIYAPYLVL